MFDYQKGVVYFDGNFTSFDNAKLSIASSPVLYGLSVYTVFNAVYDNETAMLTIFRLKDHYKRLVNSAKIMDFHSFVEEWTYDRFEQTMRQLLEQNNIKENVLVRVTVYIDELIAGTKIHGLKNNISAYVYPMGEILPRSGIHTCISSWQRTPDNTIPSRAKINGSYINASLMKNEALLNGYDEAIAVDQSGHIAEGTVANIFMVRDGVLITPDTGTDILEGITRDSIIKLAQNLEIPVIARAIDRSELYIADELFMCGSSANITPVLSVDKRAIGNGKVGDITSQLSKSYSQAQRGQLPNFADWIMAL